MLARSDSSTFPVTLAGQTKNGTVDFLMWISNNLIRCVFASVRSTRAFCFQHIWVDGLRRFEWKIAGVDCENAHRNIWWYVRRGWDSFGQRMCIWCDIRFIVTCTYNFNISYIDFHIDQHDFLFVALFSIYYLHKAYIISHLSCYNNWKHLYINNVRRQSDKYIKLILYLFCYMINTLLTH